MMPCSARRGNMSRITILALGTRGDVQALVALGVGLQSTGHDVTIAADSQFENLVIDNNLKFIPIQTNIKKFVHEMTQDLSQQGVKNNSSKPFLNTLKKMKPFFSTLAKEYWEACLNAEVVMPQGITAILAYSMLEKLEHPPLVIPANVNPLHHTNSFPSLLSPIQKNFSKTFNKISWWYKDFLTYFYIKPLNQWRKNYLNLPPYKIKPRDIWLYGISPTVLPKPNDWDETLHLTGFWRLKPSGNWQPSLELDNFLKSGPPPFCITLGSIFGYGKFSNKEKIVEIILESLNKTKQRAILISSADEFTSIQPSKDIFISNEVNFDWLFPKLTAIIDHAGIGTSSAALIAGIPSICVPIVADQFFWAHRMHEIGASTKPIPLKRLSTDLLTKAINEVIDYPYIREKVLAIKKRMQKEDGVATAVELINNYIKYKKES